MLATSTMLVLRRGQSAALPRQWFHRLRRVSPPATAVAL